MSWQGQVNQPIGVAGIDGNGKIHALDASQLYNLNASNISSGNIAVARLPSGGVNGANQLVQLDASGNLPTLDASSLTNLNAANISGSIPTSNLNKATTSAFGVVQIGSNINVSTGVISVPAATTSALGVVQPDGVTTTIAGAKLVTLGIPNYQSSAIYNIGNQIRGDGTNGVIGATYTCNTNSTTGAFTTANWSLFGYAGDSTTIFGQSGYPSSASGFYNVGIGAGSFSSLTFGDSNVAVGYNALLHDTVGSQNIAIGLSALEQNTTGNENTGVGSGCLAANTIGGYNTVIGSAATINLDGGSYNTAVGYSALQSATTSSYNTVLGSEAGFNITTGQYNTIVGTYKGTASMNNTVVLSDGQQNVVLSIATGNAPLAANKFLATPNGSTGAASPRSIVSADLPSIPNSLTTATSTNTASAIVARDSSGDFSAHNVTVTGSLIGNASNYNAFAPTVISGSGTLTTDISMLISTGAGGYTTTLPDAATFPASQLGKPIYYINNSSAPNTIGVETGGFTSIAFSITGATTTPPLYSLDATHLPTVTSMTIAGNVATATANSASAQTFDYVTTNNILQVTPKMTFTNGNVLSVDPTSATGSTKFNYSVNNTVQVGSKIQVDVGGTVSEITVAAGSQSSNSIFDSGWGQLSFLTANNKLFAYGGTSRQLAVSNDEGASWTYLTQFGGTGISRLTSVVYFNNKYFFGLSYNDNQTSVSLYASTDLINWTTANTISGASSCGVATDDAILSVAYGGSRVNTYTNIQIFSSDDGSTFTSRVNDAIAVNGVPIDSYNYSNGKFLLSAWNFIYESINGTSYIRYTSNIVLGLGSPQAIFYLYYTGSIYIISSGGGVAEDGIYTTAALSTTAVKQQSFTQPGWLTYNGSTYLIPQSGTTTIYTSTNGSTWSSSTIAETVNIRAACVYNGKYFYGSATGQNMLTTVNLSSWTATDLAASSGYQFTMTSPSIAVPTWAGLGGQTEQYSVSATSTPSFVAASTPVYTRSTNDITITYAAVTPSAYTHLQLKVLTMNSGDILKQIGADLHIDVDLNVTIPVGGKYALIPTSTAGWQSFQFAG